MEKTAMQQLRDRIFNDSEIFVTRETICTWIDNVGLEIEKQQIKTSYQWGYSDGCDDSNGDNGEFEDDNDYFEKTFGDKE